MDRRTADRPGSVAPWIALAATVLLVLSATGFRPPGTQGGNLVASRSISMDGNAVKSVGGLWSTSNPKVPGTPTAVTTVPGNRTVDVAWSPPTNGSPSATNYSASLGTTYQGPWIANVDTAGTHASFAGLTNGQAYYVVVSASNANGSGPPSMPQEVIPAGVPFPPGPPRLEWVTGTSLNVSWSSPVTDQGAAVTNYTVLFDLNLTDVGGGAGWDRVSVGTAQSYRINGIAVGSNVSVRIQAWNSIGGSALSALAMARNPAGVPASGAGTTSGATLGIAVLLVVIVLVVLATVVLALRGRKTPPVGPRSPDPPTGEARTRDVGSFPRKP